MVVFPFVYQDRTNPDDAFPYNMFSNVYGRPRKKRPRSPWKGYFLIKIGLITLAFCTPELSKIGFTFGFIFFHLGCGLIWSTQLQVRDSWTDESSGPMNWDQGPNTDVPRRIPRKVANLFHNRMTILCIIIGASNGSNSIGMGLVQEDFQIDAHCGTKSANKNFVILVSPSSSKIDWRCITNWAGPGRG